MGACISKIMYMVEKCVAFGACVCLIACLILTLVFTLGLGVGLGYNYCYVGMKSTTITPELTTTETTPDTTAEETTPEETTPEELLRLNRYYWPIPREHDIHAQQEIRPGYYNFRGPYDHRDQYPPGYFNDPNRYFPGKKYPSNRYLPGYPINRPHVYFEHPADRIWYTTQSYPRSWSEKYDESFGRRPYLNQTNIALANRRSNYYDDNFNYKPLLHYYYPGFPGWYPGLGYRRTYGQLSNITHVDNETIIHVHSYSTSPRYSSNYYNDTYIDMYPYYNRPYFNYQKHPDYYNLFERSKNKEDGITSQPLPSRSETNDESYFVTKPVKPLEYNWTKHFKPIYYDNESFESFNNSTLLENGSISQYSQPKYKIQTTFSTDNQEYNVSEGNDNYKFNYYLRGPNEQITTENGELVQQQLERPVKINVTPQIEEVSFDTTLINNNQSDQLTSEGNFPVKNDFISKNFTENEGTRMHSDDDSMSSKRNISTIQYFGLNYNKDSQKSQDKGQLEAYPSIQYFVPRSQDDSLLVIPHRQYFNPDNQSEISLESRNKSDNIDILSPAIDEIVFTPLKSYVRPKKDAFLTSTNNMTLD